MDTQLILDHIGSRCTVLTQDNTFLFLGSLSHFDQESCTLTVDDTQGERALWSDISLNMTIKIQLKANNQKGKLVLLVGKVLDPMKNSLTVTISNALVKEESRNFFRQNVMRKGFIVQVNGIAVNHSCTILDISATGIAIQSCHPYQINDCLTMQNQIFRQGGSTHNVTFQVARTSPMDSKSNLFGCRFVDLKASEEDKLFQDIFSLQATELHDKRHV